MSPVTSAAPAKLNLTLAVVGRRADGYHLLDSLVAFTEFGDTVAAEPAEALTLALTGPFAAGLANGPGENLVLCAARLLAAEAGVTDGAALILTKRLPVASGIGGGSSDAAATLRVLSELWRIAPAPGDLDRLALGLGADVPVCLAGRPARLQGIGERVTPLAALPSVPVVLVNPGVALATPAVFKARRGGFSAGLGDGTTLPGDAAGLAAALMPHGNDLTAAATGLLPVIGEVLDRLAGQAGCLLARMSGSGATCFALFLDDAAAEAAAARLAHDRPGWWAVATRLAGTERSD